MHYLYVLANVSCPAAYYLNPYSKTCYKVVQLPKTWEDAKISCENEGGYLATFETLESAMWFDNLTQANPGDYKYYNSPLGHSNSYLISRLLLPLHKKIDLDLLLHKARVKYGRSSIMFCLQCR